MGAEYGPGTRCVRWLFIICNFIFLVVGAIAFAIGVWGVVVGSDYSVITGDETVSAAALLLVGGVITFAVAAIGIVGACAMWKPLLLIYALALVVIIILEFVAAILAFVYVDEITDVIRDNMEEAIRDYEPGDDAIENVQDTFECCGIDNATDWVRLNPDAVIENGGVPPADCSCDLDDDDDCISYIVMINGTEITFTAWSDGCLQTLEDNLEPVGIAIGVIAIIFAVVEVLLLLMAIGLCCCIYSANRKSVV